VRFHYRWIWELEASPEQLWPLVADTNRFNRDARVPRLEQVGAAGESGARRLRLARLGVGIEWDEEPFEWVRPFRFGVVRRYHGGPVAEMEVRVELTPREGGGTSLAYDVRAEPRNVLGLVAIPIEIGRRSRARFATTFARYDRLARAAVPAATGDAGRAQLSPGGRERLRVAIDALRKEGIEPALVDRLADTVRRGDELTVARLRPYVLADAWDVSRRSVLELCLHATRAGLLDLRWDLMCPRCRGPQESRERLGGFDREIHCDSCNIDFGVDLEHSVELSFAPNPSVRAVERIDFCVGGPQVTPHVVLQQSLAPGERRVLALALEPGRYRLRTRTRRGHRAVVVAAADGGDADLRLDDGDWPREELRLSIAPTLAVENAAASTQQLALERAAWSDDVATAADVTALQVFRDLFATEALRPEEPISVGSLAVLFTDLRDSTRFYRTVGDAPAFGSVLRHLDVLRAGVVAEDGAVVKTMGDAIMAVFRRPAAAIRAALAGQRALAGEHRLKVGIHVGPCIAVEQNGLLDYFGSTVNAAARLVALSNGEDVVVSAAVRDDPEVRTLNLVAEPLDAELKGFDERFDLWRLKP
jgi:class 3 adenylate cyclase